MRNNQNVTEEHELSKCCWKNGTDRFAQCRVATDLQFVKNAISVKHNIMKYAYNSTIKRQIIQFKTDKRFEQTLHKRRYLHAHVC